VPVGIAGVFSVLDYRDGGRVVVERSELHAPRRHAIAADCHIEKVPSVREERGAAVDLIAGRSIECRHRTRGAAGGRNNRQRRTR
jgi:hypothetical protein